MPKHAKLSPSSSKRWMLCPGSVALIERLGNPDTASIYALEGTAAHYLGEQCLANKWDAEDLLGKVIHVEEWENSYVDKDHWFHTGFKPATKKDTKGFDPIYREKFDVDHNMTDAVQVYVDFVREQMKFKQVKLMLEVKCSLTHLGVEGLDGGTSDTVLIFIKDEHIVVVDYKHGAGVAVEVTWTPQPMQYGLGALEKIRATGVDVSEFTVDLVIVQPRAYHPDGPVRTQYLTAEDLYHWQDTVLKPAAKATQDPDAPLVAGEDQCRFCAASPCTAQYEMLQEIAVSDFATLPDTGILTTEQKARVMEHRDMLRSFIVDVENIIKVEMDNGSTEYSDLFKLVLGKTNRKLTPLATDEFDSPLLDHLDEQELYVQKFITMTDIEKLLIKKLGREKSWEVMQSITKKPEGKTIVAPLSDKRVEIQPSVVTDFQGMAGDDLLDVYEKMKLTPIN